jgi:hypothetical protein
MAIRKLLMRALTPAALAVVTLGIAGPVQPADAAGIAHTLQAPSDCPVGLLCLWDGAQFTGPHFEFRATAPGSCHNFFPWAHSAYNRTGITQSVFRDFNCTGDRWNLPNEGSIGGLSGVLSVGGFP